MCSSVLYTAPEGMSCVNVFHILWANSKPPPVFDLFPDQEPLHAAEVSTPEKVADLFRLKTDFNYEGGRLIAIDFSEFPKLNTALYNKNFGDGSAEKAIELYKKVHPSDRFDKNDCYKLENLYIFKTQCHQICNRL